MPQTLCHLLIHCVFHKKASAPTIRDTDQRRLNLFIKDTCDNYGCSCIIVNGPGDHIHLLTTLSPEIPLSTFIKEIKRLSSRFLKECDSIYYHNFTGNQVMPASLSRVNSKNPCINILLLKKNIIRNDQHIVNLKLY